MGRPPPAMRRCSTARRPSSSAVRTQLARLRSTSRSRTKVTILYRGESLEKSMSHYLVDRIEAMPEITVRLNTKVVETHGAEALEAITDRRSG